MSLVFHSQGHMNQDQWVLDTLGGFTGGTFLDIGCGHFQNINNTLFFEESLNWRGIGIDSNPDFRVGWSNNRKSPFFCADATTIDYEDLLNRHQMPEIIDYLSIDLEPPMLSLVALRAVMKTFRRFRCITFEHDDYRKTGTLEPSRKLLKGLGYKWIEERNRQDDYWVAPDLLVDTEAESGVN